MIIKNISGHIINFGTKMVLPDNTLSVGPAIYEAPSVVTLEKMGYIVLIPEADTSATENAEPAVAVSEAVTEGPVEATKTVRKKAPAKA